MSTRAERSPADERVWLLRALLVLQSPRAVFAALRDDSDEAARARQEPVTAIVLLAGIASVLWTPVAGALLDDPLIDGILVAVWAFVGGGFYGIAVYWVLGAVLYGAGRAAGSQGTYRRARHVLAFACAPLALSLLLLWPLRLAVFGGDVFRTGGADSGSSEAAFVAGELAFVAWSAALLAIGVRAVHAWAWPRSLATVALTVGIAAAGVTLGSLAG